MKIIVTGATGTVGSELIRQAILDKDITEIIAISRNAPDIKGDKLKVVLHKDFLDYSSLGSLFAERDTVFWCLGVSQTQVNKEQYRVITHDFAVAAANAAIAANPSIQFLFVSGGGADPTEKSRTLFARVKGKTENSLQQVPFKKFIIVRPGAIKPIHVNKNMPFLYKLLLPLFPVIELFAPGSIITSVQLAKAMLKIAKKGSDKIIIENKELKQLGL